MIAHTVLVKYPFENGSNINEKDGYGKTALHYGKSKRIMIF